MNRNFVLCTDTIIDTSEEFFTNNNIKPIEHGIVIDGKEIFDGFCKVITEHDIYKMLRDGKEISTVQGNIEQMYLNFEDAAKNGLDLLYICFSSALSGTFNTANMVARDTMEKYPECTIVVVDSKCAAAGQGLLVRDAINKKIAGASMQEIADMVEENRNKIHHVGFIDSLEHLKRGGRISKTSALVGGIVGIKPIVGVTADGSLENMAKARGITKAYQVLATHVQANLDEGEDVYISHCDNIEYAEHLKSLILEQTSAKNVYIYYLGNTIGCHVGPDSVFVFFKGKPRS